MDATKEPQRESDADRELTLALHGKLPQFSAPLALKRRLAENWPKAARPRSWQRRALVPAVAMAAALVIAVVTAAVVQQRADERTLDGEAVNDHLRILAGAPLAQVTGGLHEVKPWFGGKLDFAPEVAFAGDADFPLQGGAVESFLDRRAAVFVYRRRLHTISLFVVRAAGLDLPARVHTEIVRGYHVIVWKSDDQGFVLTSDLNLPELRDLAQRIARAQEP